MVLMFSLYFQRNVLKIDAVGQCLFIACFSPALTFVFCYLGLLMEKGSGITGGKRVECLRFRVMDLR